MAPKDRGTVPQRSKTAEEKVVAADLFLDRYETNNGAVPAADLAFFTVRTHPKLSWARARLQVSLADVGRSEHGNHRQHDRPDSGLGGLELALRQVSVARSEQRLGHLKSAVGLVRILSHSDSPAV